jgi:hypothetical protein
MTPNKCKCNWLPSIARITDIIWGHTLGYYVYCENCGHQGKIKPTQEEAITNWNEEKEENK